jgi:hypothetical protein
MSFPTTGVLFSGSTPVAPPGDQLCVPQSDGGQPAQLTSVYPRKATTALRGTVKPDNVTTQVDGTGTISVIAPGGGTGGTGPGGSASGGQYVCVVPAPDPTDGTRTQWILPAPVLAGTDYWLNRNDTIQRQLGIKAYFSVQGTQLTLVSPLEGDGYLEFHYIQGTPNSESGGGGTTTPVGAPVIRGSAVTSNDSSTGLTLALPAGSQAGDFALFFYFVSWSPNGPAGWTTVYLSTTSGNKLLVGSKTLTSGDISAGSITCTQTNPPFGPAADPNGLFIVTFVGATGGVRETQYANGASVTLVNTTTGAVINTDIAIYAAWVRGSSEPLPTITPASGSANTLQTIPSTPSQVGILADQAMPGGALAVTTTATSSGAWSDVQVIVKGS